MTNDTIRFPPGISENDLVGRGLIGLVALDTGGSNVIKFAIDRDHQEYIDVERRVYERLEGSVSFLGYRGQREHGIILEYATNDTIRKYQSDTGQQPSSVRFRWAKQLASSVAFLHSKRIFHGNISCNNIFLDDKLDSKLGDFAGSSIDGEPALIGYETTHELPNQPAASVDSELFALGSTLYEIMTGSIPYAGLSDSSIRAAYQKNDFPDINHLEALRDIITSCWQRQYQSADEILVDIQGEGNSLTLLFSIQVCLHLFSSYSIKSARWLFGP
jgi:serine/threonine protein kinase